MFRIFIVITFFLLMNFNINSKENNDSFKIIFWDKEDLDINQDNSKLLKNITYDELLNNRIWFEIKSNDILEYYWNEQLLVFNRKDLESNTGFYFSDFGYFTIVMNNKTLYSGIVRTVELAAIFEEDKMICPVIVSSYVDEDLIILGLKPSYKTKDEFNSTFKLNIDKIFDNNVKNYFKKLNTINLGDLPAKYNVNNSKGF